MSCRTFNQSINGKYDYTSALPTINRSADYLSCMFREDRSLDFKSYENTRLDESVYFYHGDISLLDGIQASSSTSNYFIAKLLL